MRAGEQFGHAFFAARALAAQFDRACSPVAPPAACAIRLSDLGAVAGLHQVGEIAAGQRRRRRRRIARSAALASVITPSASANATPIGASRNSSPIFGRRGCGHGCGAARRGCGAAARGAARRQHRLRRGAGGQARREPPGGLPVRQRTHRGDDLQARHHRKAFLARPAFGGIARQTIEHGGDWARPPAPVRAAAAVSLSPRRPCGDRRDCSPAPRRPRR